MANIVITQTGDEIHVDFGVYAQAVGYDSASFARHDIDFMGKIYNENQIRVIMNTNILSDWRVVASGDSGSFPKAFVIDTVLGISIDNVTTLQTQLQKLIQ